MCGTCLLYTHLASMYGHRHVHHRAALTTQNSGQRVITHANVRHVTSHTGGCDPHTGVRHVTIHTSGRHVTTHACCGM